MKKKLSVIVLVTLINSLGFPASASLNISPQRLGFFDGVDTPCTNTTRIVLERLKLARNTAFKDSWFKDGIKYWVVQLSPNSSIKIKCQTTGNYTWAHTSATSRGGAKDINLTKKYYSQIRNLFLKEAVKKREYHRCAALNCR